MKPGLSRRLVLGAAMAPALFGILQPSPADATSDPRLAAAIASPIRRPSNKNRDRYRHPEAALHFFGLQDNQSVVEIEPGAGYWTEILAPYLKPHGAYVAAIPAAPNDKREQAANARFIARLRADPTDYGKVTVSVFDRNTPIAPPNSIDLVLSFRNLHDWMADGTATQKLAAIFVILKPGGVLGIEDHRGITTQPQDPLAKSGYVREDYATALIKNAGFRLAGASPIGNNKLDTKNYPKGVWTLPPVLAMGATDRAKYLAIGESDRWTLKFVKP